MTIFSRPAALLCSTLLCATCVHAQDEAPLPADNVEQESLAAPEQAKPALERNRLWTEAEGFAEQKNWRDAIRVGKAAYQLHTKEPVGQPVETCRMLELLCVWHTRAREFPAALAAARELLTRRKELLGEEHWQTVDARLNVTLVEQLSYLGPDDWKQFLTAEELNTEAADLLRLGKNAAALEKVEKALSIYIRLLGLESTSTLSCLSNFITCHLELGKYIKAFPYLNEFLKAQPRIKGKDHPDTILALKLSVRFSEATGDLNFAEARLREIVEIQTNLSGPNHPDTIAAQVELAKLLIDLGKREEAEQILVPALEQQRKLFSEEHLATAETMKVLGTLYTQPYKHLEAEPLLTKSAEVFRRLAGERHLSTASAYSALGKLNVSTKHFRTANEYFTKSLQIYRDVLGDQHPDTARILDNVAEFNEAYTTVGRARQFRLESLHIVEQSLGEMTLRTADALEKVATCYIALQDYVLAQPYLVRAHTIRHQLLGDDHPKTAAIVALHAHLFLASGHHAIAEPLYKQALAVVDKTPVAEQGALMRVREELASLYRRTGRLEEAEAEFRKELEIRTKQTSPEDSWLAELKTDLALTLLSRGKHQEACQLVEETHSTHSIGVYHGRFADDDYRWYQILATGGRIQFATGNPVAAESQLSSALLIARSWMEHTGAFESERQRLQQMRSRRQEFDLYLSLPKETAQEASWMYYDVLVWKGAIATRQWRDRQIVSAETAPLIAELQQLCRQWSALSLCPPDPAEREPWKAKIFDLILRKEGLEEQLAATCDKLRKDRTDPRLGDLARMLSPRTALIDIFQYTHTSFEKEGDVPQAKSRERFTAYILRDSEEVQSVDLGDVEAIAEAVTNWRKTRGFRPNKGKTDWAATLGKLVWSPLEPYLKDCDTLLISPDGVLSHLAWNALPGRKPDTYLIEDYAIGMVPVPQLLAAANKPAQPPNQEVGAEPANRIDRSESLLLLGDVDYDAAPKAKSASTKRHGRLNFPPLKGTAVEVQALHDRFQQCIPHGDVLLLDKANATEDAFWREAPRHRWLHIATHGFFAPSAIKAAIIAQRRSDPTADGEQSLSILDAVLANGLALAGANCGAVDERDDGILTALELSMMDLHNVEVAVLSGCETGLGEALGGEGSFGMQRTLQIAGVGATVCSLWTVSDEKTNLLMQRFYSNLWDKKLPKLQALREAQLWLLRTGGNENAAAPKRLSPHYWAAFTLSGDWR